MRFVAELGTVGGSLQGSIKYCKDLEMDGLSVPFARVPGFQEKGYLSLDSVRAMKKEIEDAGLSFSAMVVWAPPSIINGGQEGEEQFSNLRKSLECMHDVGADHLMMFQPLKDEKQWDPYINFYRRLMEQAEKCNVKISAHTHGIFKSYAVMKRLLEGAPSPYNGICYCTGNVWHVEGEGMYDVIRRLGEKIFFVHIRNVKTGQGEKEYWFDKGDVDMLKVIQALKDINYRGDVRSEHLPTDLYRNAPQPPGISDIGTAFAVGYMRALLKTIP